MGAKHSAVPSVFSIQYLLLLFIEQHLHEGGTAERVYMQGDGGRTKGPSFTILCGKLLILPAPNQPSVCLAG